MYQIMSILALAVVTICIIVSYVSYKIGYRKGYEKGCDDMMDMC